MSETTLLKVALAKAVPDKDYKEASSLLAPETYLVAQTVRILGTLKKGQPYEQRVTAKANPWKLLALALSKLNSTTAAALVAEARDLPDDIGDGIKAEAEALVAQIQANAPTVTVAGRVTAQLVWETVA